MKVIIIGAGKVGKMLAGYAASDGIDVVLIDLDEKKLEEAVNQYDIIGAVGNGANIEVLEEAGANDADLVISVTEGDELNILACMMAKQMGAKDTIARVRNPDYSSQHDFMRNQLGFSMIINPEMSAAREINKILLFPSAIKIDAFAKGRVELAEFRLPDRSRLQGTSLSEFPKHTKSNVLVCAVSRNDEVIIPSGDFIFAKDDHIYVTGTHRELAIFCMEIGVISRPMKDIIIIGGGRTAYYLTRLLTASGMKVKIIEQNHQRCVELSRALPMATIIEGDGSDEELLLEEGIENCDAIVALTSTDEENIVISFYAKQLKVKKAIAKVDRTSLAHLVDHIGIDSVISSKNIIASEIIRYIRSKENTDEESQVQTLYKIVNDQVEAMEFIVNSKTSFVGKRIQDINIKNGILIGAIYRGDDMIVPRGNQVIEHNDHLIIITTDFKIRRLNDIVED